MVDSMLFPDLSLTVSHRRRACVLDPRLVLCRFGLPLIRRLGDFVELWMPRELWHILDNSQFYLEHPESLFQGNEDEKQDILCSTQTQDDIVAAIKVWEQIRLESDLGGLKVFWVGDGLSESLVPPGTSPSLVWRYESFAHALDRRQESTGAIACAARDTAALAAALGTAFVLTNRTTKSVEAGKAPAICNALPHMRCELVAKADPIAAIEIEYLRHLLVYSGAANLLWSGLHLAVLHFALPSASTFLGSPPSTLRDELTELDTVSPGVDADPNLWDGVRAYWYPL